MRPIKHLLLKAAAHIGSRQSKRLRGCRALIIPPAGPGSVGDAAMLTSVIAALRKRGFERVSLLQVERGKSWDLDCAPDELVDGSHFLDYGSRVNLSAILIKLGGYSDIFCIGADILDGIYDEDRMAYRLELLHRAADMGLRATIVGSSFSEQPNPRCVSMIQALPSHVRILARDEFSHQRMTRALTRPIELCADVAFLLSPADTAASALPVMVWLQSERDAGRKVVAINANNLHEAHHPSLIRDYAALVRELIARGCSILMVPHDNRTQRSDQFIADAIVEMLSEDCTRHVHTFRAKTPGQLKLALAQCDLIVTGRMHAAIIALGSHTPAMSFAYANKFEGLYQHLDLDPGEMILTLSALRDEPRAVAAEVMKVLARSEGLREHIAARIGLLRQAAERNFDGGMRMAS